MKYCGLVNDIGRSQYFGDDMFKVSLGVFYYQKKRIYSDEVPMADIKKLQWRKSWEKINEERRLNANTRTKR